MRDSRTDDSPSDERDQLIGNEAKPGSGDYRPQPAPRRTALGAGKPSRQEISQNPARIWWGRDGRLYLVDEAVEQEAGAEEGDGEEERDVNGLRAVNRHRRAAVKSRPRGRHGHQAPRPRGDATSDDRQRPLPRARG